MTIRKAEPKDYSLVIEMGLKFIKTTEYVNHYNEAKLKAVIAEFVYQSHTWNKVCFLYEDYGMLLGVFVPFLFGNKLVATEVAWWVEPDKRKTGAGKALLEAFEKWAKEQGCSLVTMISLDDELNEFYKKKGYRLTELAYMKEI